MLVAPEDLTEAEASVWDTVAHEVSGAGAGELLRAWCSSVVELRAAESWVRENGTQITIRDDKGNVKSVVHAPKYVQVRALRGDLVRLGDALCLSPRSRSGVTAVADSTGSPLDELRRRRAVRGANTAS